MKSSNFLKLAVARRRGAGITAAALAACGAALAPTGAQAAGYSFQTINDPADFPPPPGAGGLTFTNLMGITSNGDTIPGFYGSGQAGDPNTGFVLTLPEDVHRLQRNFPGGDLTPANPNDGDKRKRHDVHRVHVPDKHWGARSISSSASTSRAGRSPWSTTRRLPTAVSRARATRA